MIERARTEGADPDWKPEAFPALESSGASIRRRPPSCERSPVVGRASSLPAYRRRMRSDSSRRRSASARNSTNRARCSAGGSRQLTTRVSCAVRKGAGGQDALFPHGQRRAVTGTSTDDMCAALAKMGQAGRGVIHLHGGLVAHGTALAGAERMAPLYQRAGAHPLADA